MAALEPCEYCGKKHRYSSLTQQHHQAMLKMDYVRGKPLYYSRWGPSPDDLITCLRCGCNYMARLGNHPSGTFICRDCGMEHDNDGAMIGEAEVGTFRMEDD